jgi:hypothetical protein
MEVPESLFPAESLANPFPNVGSFQGYAAR